ncbi:MAG: ribonuclease E/G [Lachnospiraceae bacterium]|nr:ribonuclease E/G [Lachnospiraceae bacterium]
MSRKIAQKPSVTITKEEAALRQTASQGKLLFTSYHGQRCALSIRDDRLIDASFFPKIPSKIGSVYIGKVKSVAKNINACFVEIEKGELCFLSLKETGMLQTLNRTPDGRLLEGDEILVQVTRDAQKSKRASVTAQISLSNDYFVLAMGSERVCYSTKLDKKQKGNLHKFLQDLELLNIERGNCLTQECRLLLPDAWYTQSDSEHLDFSSPKFSLPPTGLIVRTRAGELECAEELSEHFYQLAAAYLRLLYIARYRSCFSCLKRTDTEILAALEQFTGEHAAAQEIRSEENVCMDETPHSETAWEIITDQETFYEQLLQHEKKNSLGIPIRFYQDSMLTLSALYAVESKMKTALESRVWLKSGGYLVIEPTEALTVIDVNTGKYEAGKNPEDTYRKVNLEAAEEVALQLRLRNLSGIIIVDFINMRTPGDNAHLLHVLKSLVKQDKIQTTVIDMTPLGLVEITRKKISKPLREQLQTYSI